MKSGGDERVVEIGACASCVRFTRISDGVCSGCVARYGANLARIFGRVRHDQAFAVMCFEAIPERQRLLFVSMFGNPWHDPWPTRRSCGANDERRASERRPVGARTRHEFSDNVILPPPMQAEKERT